VFLNFFLIVVALELVFELRALSLQSRRSTTRATPPVHFALVIFGDGGLTNYLPRLTSNPDLPDLSLLSS
jgi:hypothetical protein